MPGKIYFRGDSRPPSDIFQNGFEKRYPMCPIQYRDFQAGAGDINESTAVCFSTRLEVAALFPLNNQPRYIYAFYLDDSLVTDTHRLQIQDAERHMARLTGAARTFDTMFDIGWVIFANERAADRVPNSMIWGAVHCTIASRRSDGFRVTFACSRIARNFLCTLPPAIGRRIVRALALAVRGGTRQSPEPGAEFRNYLLL